VVVLCWLLHCAGRLGVVLRVWCQGDHAGCVTTCLLSSSAADPPAGWALSHQEVWLCCCVSATMGVCVCVLCCGNVGGCSSSKHSQY
jgi:hypothetical protein